MKRIEELISKCVRGKASREIIQEIEDEIPDINSVLSELRTDLATLAGLPVNASYVEGSKIIIKSNTSDVKSILDTYSRIYPEVEFLLDEEKED